MKYEYEIFIYNVLPVQGAVIDSEMSSAEVKRSRNSDRLLETVKYKLFRFIVCLTTQ